jgi:hypothetical protein
VKREATVGFAHGQSDEPRFAKRLVGAADVRRRLGAPIGSEFGLRGPVFSGLGLKARRERCAGFQDRLIGANLGLEVHWATRS